MADLLAFGRAVLGFLNENNGAAIVLLTAVLVWMERRRGRARLQLREASTREHFYGPRYPGHGLWFLIANSGGIDCPVDMGRSYLLLERREARERNPEGWFAKQLPYHWRERWMRWKRRPTRFAVWSAILRGWHTAGVSIYSAEHWYQIESRDHRPQGRAFAMESDFKGTDLTVKAGSLLAYCAAYSLDHRDKRPGDDALRTRRAILVVKPVVGSAARMRLTVTHWPKEKDGGH